MEMLTNGVWLATNGVTVRYQEAVLTARKASVNQLTGEVAAQGDVRLQRGPDLLIADSVQYNFLTKKIIGDNLKWWHVILIAIAIAVNLGGVLFTYQFDPHHTNNWVWITF